MSELTFADLRCRYQTGRSFVISGEGRNRVYGYRNGIQCALGDIERSEWCKMVQELIRLSNEEKLYMQLLDWLKDHNYAKESRKELEFHALQLHAARIFENECWVDFVKFHSRFCPERLAFVRLIWVRNACCKKPGQITQALHEANPIQVCCPHCGRWSEYEIMSDFDVEGYKNAC